MRGNPLLLAIALLSLFTVCHSASAAPHPTNMFGKYVGATAAASPESMRFSFVKPPDMSLKTIPDETNAGMMMAVLFGSAVVLAGAFTRCSGS